MTTPRENPQPPAVELPPEEEMAITPYDGAQSLIMTDQDWADEIVARVNRQDRIVEAFISTLDPETDLCIVFSPGNQS